MKNPSKAEGEVARLAIYSRDGAAIDTIPLLPGEYTIGRDETECDIVYSGKDTTLSRAHAILTIKAGEAHIRDLNSSAGTMVDNQVVQKARIYDGDILQLGKLKFVLSLPQHVGDKAHEGRHVKMTVSSDEYDLAGELNFLKRKCDNIKREVAKVIVGQTEIVNGVMVALLTQSHCLLLGVPGLAKTMMVRTFSRVLGLQNKRIQFTPDLMPSDIIGSEILKKSSDGVPELEFAQGPIFTQLLLADEINRTPPKTQSALLEAMQESQVTVAMKSYQLPFPFCVIATQNPIEQEGTYPLPEAQQDRFMLCLRLDYPSYEDELEIISRTTTGEPATCQQAVTESDIIRFHRAVKSIGVPREQIEYATKLARATRPESEESAKAGVADLIDWGAGPRAGQAAIRGAKALAAMDGRPAISQDDVREVLMPVLRHRISCNYRSRSEGLSEEDVIGKIIKFVK